MISLELDGISKTWEPSWLRKASRMRSQHGSVFQKVSFITNVLQDNETLFMIENSQMILSKALYKS
jgi:hypothetical protein